MTKKNISKPITFDEIKAAMDEAVETTSFVGKIRDWRTMPELAEDPDDEEVFPPGVEIILQIGAEGGDLTLYGHRTNTGWEFTREIVDQTAAMLDEQTAHHRSETVTTIEEALRLLDRYPWHRLYPLKVHPEFSKPILAAIREQIAREGGSAIRGLERWERACTESK